MVASKPPARLFESLYCASYDFCCGIEGSGKAKCWGYNSFGQSSVPSNVNFGMIASSFGFGCGLSTSGKAVRWGGPSYTWVHCSLAGSFAWYDCNSASSIFCCGIATAAEGGLTSCTTPTIVPPATKLEMLSCGSNFCCGIGTIAEGGKSVCWFAFIFSIFAVPRLDITCFVVTT